MKGVDCAQTSRECPRAPGLGRAGLATTVLDMRSGRRSQRDYLAIFSLTVTGIFVCAVLGLAVIMVFVQREHVAAERAVRREHVAFKRAHQRCERNKPALATGWTLNWNATTRTFRCIYERNSRPLPPRN